MRRINLIDPGANKIAVISTIRNSTNLSLKEAKDLVDRVPSSFEVEDSVAQELIGQLRSKGAVVQSESGSVTINSLETAETALINGGTELTTSPLKGACTYGDRRLSMSKFCPKCGVETSDDAKICRSCGSAFPETVEIIQKLCSEFLARVVRKNVNKPMNVYGQTIKFLYFTRGRVMRFKSLKKSTISFLLASVMVLAPAFSVFAETESFAEVESTAESEKFILAVEAEESIGSERQMSESAVDENEVASFFEEEKETLLSEAAPIFKGGTVTYKDGVYILPETGTFSLDLTGVSGIDLTKDMIVCSDNPDVAEANLNEAIKKRTGSYSAFPLYAYNEGRATITYKLKDTGAVIFSFVVHVPKRTSIQADNFGGAGKISEGDVIVCYDSNFLVRISNMRLDDISAEVRYTGSGKKESHVYATGDNSVNFILYDSANVTLSSKSQQGLSLSFTVEFDSEFRVTQVEDTENHKDVIGLYQGFKEYSVLGLSTEESFGVSIENEKIIQRIPLVSDGNKNRFRLNPVAVGQTKVTVVSTENPGNVYEFTVEISGSEDYSKPQIVFDQGGGERVTWNIRVRPDLWTLTVLTLGEGDSIDWSFDDDSYVDSVAIGFNSSLGRPTISFRCIKEGTFTLTAVAKATETHPELKKAVIIYSGESKTVTWKNWDGTTLETDRNVAYGAIPTYDGATPTRPADTQYSYAFAGWDKAITAVTGDVTYTAVFTQTAKRYKVTFDANGHGTSPAAITVSVGQKIIKPADPSASSYAFGGWYKEAACTNEWKFDTELMPGKDITLYAKWTYSGSTTGGGGTSSGGSGGGGGGSSSGGSGGGGSAGGPGAKSTAVAGAPTFSKNWVADAAGVWRIKDKAGNYVTSAWLCDDAVAANGQSVWYLMNMDGTMLAAGLVQDNTGNYYSLEMNHNGYYGMLRYKNGTYDGIYMEFSQKHDGTFGAITNQSAIDALKAKYGVTKFGIGNDRCVYTKSFE